MQSLENANVQKCVELLEDFCEAVPVDEGNHELLEKRKQADYALNHLSQLFSEVEEPLSLSGCDDRARNCRG